MTDLVDDFDENQENQAGGHNIRSKSLRKSKRASTMHQSVVQGQFELDKQIRKTIDFLDSSNVCETSNQVIECVKSADKILEKLDHKAVISLYGDSSLISKSAHASAKLSAQLEVDSRQFDVGDFSRRLAELYGTDDGDGQRDLHQPFNVNFSSLNEFANIFRNPVTSHLAEQWPSIDNNTGGRNTVSTQATGRQGVRPSTSTDENSSENEQNTQKRRRIKFSTTVTAAPNVIDTREAQEEVGIDDTSLEVDQMKKRLKKLYRQAGQVPVRYISWVCDTDSFVKTVENTFHSMFLCKEGTVKLTQGEDTNAYVEPIIKETDVEQVEQDGNDVQVELNKFQAVFRLDYGKWKKWCNSLESVA